MNALRTREILRQDVTTHQKVTEHYVVYGEIVLRMHAMATLQNSIQLMVMIIVMVLVFAWFIPARWKILIVVIMTQAMV